MVYCERRQQSCRKEGKALNVTSKGRYALRVMLDLAEREPGAYVPLREIIRRQEIPQKYLEGIMARLVRAELADSLHGKGGGYRLARAPEDIRIGDVLRLTEGSLAPVQCLEAGQSGCARSEECRTLPMWRKFNDLTNAFFDSVTLADLINQ